MADEKIPHIVIVGAGFGGIQAAKTLANASVRITVIDQRNHHLFQPLLYQVATAALATSEVAWPIRHLLRRHPNITTVLGTVVGVDTAAKRVLIEGEDPVSYDTLLLATGARHAYFGHDEWEPYAPGLKTLEDATTIRRRMLSAFEQAELETDTAKRQALLTFVVVGAGPTGVELAGTIAELAHHVLPGDFRNIDTRSSRIILIEAGPRVLASFTPDLSGYAERALKKLGVDVLTGKAVTKCDADGVDLGGETIPARTIIWAAGVAASPVAQWLGIEGDRAGRVRVEPNLSVPGHPDIFLVGDASLVLGPDGKPVPGVAPAAKQEGHYAGEVILARLRGQPAPPPFAFKSVGNLATIGKRAAIVDLGWLKLKGRIAWWFWGIVHIFFLIGVRNRISVALNWLWIYLSGHRSARLITQGKGKRGT